MKSSEITSVFGISRSMLRYYEKCGYISPARDDHGHRIFTVSDVFTILELHRQSELGISPADLSLSSEESSLHSLTSAYMDLISSRRADLLRSLPRTLLMVRILEDEKQMLSTLELNLNHYWFERRPALIYRSFSNIYSQNSQSFSALSSVQNWSDISAFCSTEMICPVDNGHVLSDNAKWCFIMPKSYLDVIDVPYDSAVAERNAMVTNIRCSFDDHEVIDAMNAMLKEAKERKLKIAEDSIIGARLCLHTTEDNQEYFYYRLYLPLAE